MSYFCICHGLVCVSRHVSTLSDYYFSVFVRPWHNWTGFFNPAADKKLSAIHFLTERWGLLLGLFTINILTYLHIYTLPLAFIIELPVLKVWTRFVRRLAFLYCLQYLMLLYKSVLLLDQMRWRLHSIRICYIEISSYYFRLALSSLNWKLCLRLR